MRFKINKRDLEEALNIVKGGIKSKSSILKNVLITADNKKMVLI